jgi:hypothetical protein
VRLTLSVEPSELARRDPAELWRAAHAALDVELGRLGIAANASPGDPDLVKGGPDSAFTSFVPSIVAGNITYGNVDHAIADGGAGPSIRHNSPPISPPANAKMPVIVQMYTHLDERGKPLPANPARPTFNPGIRTHYTPVPSHVINAESMARLVEQSRAAQTDPERARMRAGAMALIQDFATRRFDARSKLQNNSLGVFDGRATGDQAGGDPFASALTADDFLPQPDVEAQAAEYGGQSEDDDDIEDIDTDASDRGEGDEEARDSSRPDDRGRSPVSGGRSVARGRSSVSALR